MAVTYLPPPIKVVNNHIDRKTPHVVTVGCSIALGILSYYSPKTFLATSVGIFAYQFYKFNQLVQTANSMNQSIYGWAGMACLVMTSVGIVFGINSLPCFWSAITDLRHLHLIHSVSHLAKGAILMLVGIALARFKDSANNLASRGRWVAMEDYVKNYPKEGKKEILSSYKKQIGFYICALVPQTYFALLLSRNDFYFSQFRSEENKRFFLRYFEKVDMQNWPLWVHQFQQLSIENQLILVPKLAAKASKFSEKERNQFPDDIKAIILHETLELYQSIPSVQGDGYDQWQAIIAAFEQLDRESQSFLGYQLARLVQTIERETIPASFTESMRLQALLAALKSWGDLNTTFSTQSVFVPRVYEDILYDGLTDPFKKVLGANLLTLVSNGLLKEVQLSEKMQAVLAEAKHGHVFSSL